MPPESTENHIRERLRIAAAIGGRYPYWESVCAELIAKIDAQKAQIADLTSRVAVSDETHARASLYAQAVGDLDEALDIIQTCVDDGVYMSALAGCTDFLRKHGRLK